MNRKILITIVASISMLMVFACNRTAKESTIAEVEVMEEAVEEVVEDVVKPKPAPLQCEHYRLGEGEVFYRGGTSDMNNTGYFQVGFVLSADKKSINLIIVECADLNLHYKQGNITTTASLDNMRYYYVSCPINKIVCGDSGESSIANLVFNADEATGVVNYSYEAKENNGKKTIVPIGSVEMNFKAVV